MKRKRLLHSLALQETDFVRIHEAITNLEKNSSGEIAVALIGESNDYSFYELMASVCIGLLYFAFMLPFYDSIAQMLSNLFWYKSAAYITAFFGATAFFVIAFIFLISNIPAIDRFIIPVRVCSKMVYKRALQHFIESGVYATRNNTGILIFISVLEREVQIIADAGILKKIDQAKWDMFAADIARGIKQKRTTEVLLSVIQDCAKPLAEYFPRTSDDTNELSNDVTVLED